MNSRRNHQEAHLGSTQTRRDFRLACAGVALSLLAGLETGCVSKAKADAQARAAFLAGQQQAAQMLQARGPNVMVAGEVRNTLLPWTAGLTLAQAVVAAEYYGARDPSEITIIRDGQQIKIDPRRLLSGEDVLLQPRDIIELKQ
ncbi:MAG TPA: hypothetical protein VJA21_09135 [Verrucomicrobiae bacterium]